MLAVNNLSKVFRMGLLGRNPLRALNNISFSVHDGERFGLVGPSGSGKSTLARLLVRLLNPSGGSIMFNGIDIASLSQRRLQPYRRKMQIILQQPVLSLDPRKTIFQSIAEPLLVHKLAKGKRRLLDKTVELLSLTGLTEEMLFRYPHQISGGQAQRVAIARALGLEPELIVADEPTSMLDVSVQAQIFQLLGQLQQDRGITIILISHDMALVRAFCPRAALLEKGSLVALGQTGELPVREKNELLEEKLREGKTQTGAVAPGY